MHRVQYNSTKASRPRGQSEERTIAEVGLILARGIIACRHERPEHNLIGEADAPSTPRNVEAIFRQNAGLSLTCNAIARSLGVSNSTARNQLNALLRAGLVERHGSGPATTYVFKPKTLNNKISA